MDLAHPNVRERHDSLPGGSPAESNPLGSTSRARASLRTVPKCGLRILPVSIPETVVGLTPATAASLPCVHILECRARNNRSPVPNHSDFRTSSDHSVL